MCKSSRSICVITVCSKHMCIIDHTRTVLFKWGFLQFLNKNGVKNGGTVFGGTRYSGGRYCFFTAYMGGGGCNPKKTTPILETVRLG